MTALTGNDEIKNAAAPMLRDMVVLVRESKYDSAQGKFVSKFENINVLVGPQAGIDALKPKIEEFVKGFGGSFSTEFKTQAR